LLKLKSISDFVLQCLIFKVHLPARSAGFPRLIGDSFVNIAFYLRFVNNFFAFS